MTAVALCSALPLAASAAPPEWLHLMPAGVAMTVDGRGPYRLADPQSVIQRSMVAGKLVLDENHATDRLEPQGHSTPARAWIVQLQSRDDGIWGRVEWNPDAAAAQLWRGYRGISPVIAHDASGKVSAILRATLTNVPNLKGLTSLHAQGPSMDIRTQLTNAAGLAVDAPADAIMKKLKFLLDKEDHDKKPTIATQSAVVGNLVLQARAHQTEMAKAGVAIDFATAVRNVEAKG